MMVVSRNTAEEIADVVERYLPAASCLRFMHDLEAIHGNASFQATISNVTKRLMDRQESRNRAARR